MKAVMFDFDGTLFFGTACLNAYCFSRALEALGRPPLTKAQAAQIVGLTLPDICARLLGGGSDDVVNLFATRVLSFVPEYILAHVKPNRELSSLLFRLSGQAKLAVVSNADARYLEPMLQALKIRSRIDLVWPHRPGYSKAAAIPEVIKALGTGEAIMVGDRAEDVEAGKANGLRTVGILNPIFRDEVAGADRIAVGHRQLGHILQAMLK